MKIEELKNNIPELCAAVRTVVRKYHHTRKYVKHVVALVIKQLKNLTDVDLAEYVVKDGLGRMLGYKTKPHPSTFSKVRERSDPEMFKETYNLILQTRFAGRNLRLIAQDGASVPAHSLDDKEAKYGHRTPSKREQEDARGNANEMFFGYKLHMIADAESEVPLGFFIAPANMHDKLGFGRLITEVRERFRIAKDAKYLADSAYDSTDIRGYLHYHGIKDVIAINGRKYRKSETPKDPEYGRRWAIERIFSRLKEVLGLSKNRFVGKKKVEMHVYSCLIAYLVNYAM
jgi:IS5 family transposase